MSKREDSEEQGEKDTDEESKEEESKPAAESKPPAESKPAVDEDDDDDDEDDDDEDEDSEPAKRQPSRRPLAAKAQAGRGGKPAPKAAPRATSAGPSVAKSRALMFAIFALAAGGAAGWFGHDAQAKAKVRAESVAPAGSGVPAGACGAWQEKICGSSGDKSAVCAQAKGAVELLTTSGCEAAMAAMPATLAKLKAARASCETLVSKLCKDLPQGSQACDMVKERTPSFPTQRCEEMLKRYDEVIGSLREMDQRGGMPMGGPQMGNPHGPGGPGGPGAPGMPRPPMGVPGH